MLEHQFARNGVRTDGRRRALSSMPHTHRGHRRRRRGHDFAADAFVIAVGTAPYPARHISRSTARAIVDSDEILEICSVPRSLAVIGASVIGIEYATIFSALDVKVTVIEPRDDLLDFVDREIIDEFIHDLRDRGMSFGSAQRSRASRRDDQRLGGRTLEDGAQIRADMVLFAAGRVGATADAQSRKLRAGGRRPRPPRGRSRPPSRPPVPHIYAAGDVIGFPSLASTSMEQGRIAACHAFGEADAAGRRNSFPMASIRCRRFPPSA